MKSAKHRCFGQGIGKEFYAEYHDSEWGVPVHDDRLLFELLSLEGAQAGLSWETVLKKRLAYQELFHNFEIERVAAMSDEELEHILINPAIIRHRGKIYSVRQNARIALDIKKKYGSLATFLWSYAPHGPVRIVRSTLSDIPSSTPTSDKLSKDLKKMGMKFVGSTIIYAFMQAVGMVNDHLRDCWKSKIL